LQPDKRSVYDTRSILSDMTCLAVDETLDRLYGTLSRSYARNIIFSSFL